MVKTGQFTARCKGDRVIALKRQTSLFRTPQDQGNGERRVPHTHSQ